MNWRRVGVNGLIQSDFPRGAEHGNFEALVLEDDRVLHLWKDNGDVNNHWNVASGLAVGATHPPALMRADYGEPHRNFEALLVIGTLVEHWWTDANADPPVWKQGLIVTEAATGSPSLCTTGYHQQQTSKVLVPDPKPPKDKNDHSFDPPTTYHYETRTETAPHADFAALIPTEAGLGLWIRQNWTPGPWGARGTIPGTSPRAEGCMLWSDYGHLEALVFEPGPEGTGGGVYTWWYDGQWHGGNMITDRASGPASFVQSDYVKGEDHGNFEALIPELDDAGQTTLVHWWRDNAAGKGFQWHRGVEVERGTVGAASLIQADFHSDPDHGNLEALASIADQEIRHLWRDGSTMNWGSGGRAF